MRRFASLRFARRGLWGVLLLALCSVAVGPAMLVSLRAMAQPHDPPSSQVQKNLQRERDSQGDHVGVNLKRRSGTPTPGSTGRCVFECQGATPKAAVSNNGGVFVPLQTTAGTGCECPGTASNSTQVGPGASCGAVGSTCVGEGTTADTDGLAIGFGCVAGAKGMCIGSGIAPAGGIALGDLVTGEAGAFVGGSVSAPITKICYGKGLSSSSPGAQSYKGTNGAGANIIGGSIGMIPGAGTGDKESGPIFFQFCASGTPGSGVNTCSTIATFDHGHFNLIDNARLRFGDAFDAGIWYDGTNVIINPKLVGSGYVDVLGTVAATGHWTKAGGFGQVNEGTDVSVPTLVNITANTDTIPITHPVVTITLDTSRTLSSAPTLAAGVDGQRVEIWNVDGADTLTLHEDGDGGVASNLQLGAATRALAQNDGLCLRYIGALGDWVECGFWDN